MPVRSGLEMVISARERDIGGFTVRRILPYATHRMVGPFLFFDHMGPVDFKPGEGIGVRPHPHVNLATVTYLFEGKIRHRDSLGSNQLIEPGAINWMTAGKGIVHSERAPDDVRAAGGRMNGIQCWLALPEELEEIEPSFSHHPANSLPLFAIGGAELKLLLGRAFSKESPVRIHSDLFYLEAKMPTGSRFVLPSEGRDAAAYLVDGSARINGEVLTACTMAIAPSAQDLEIEALADSRVMLLGGAPLGRRHMYWNFVSSSKERIEAAKAEWRQGPRADSARFKPIPGDDREFIPLPDEIVKAN